MHNLRKLIMSEETQFQKLIKELITLGGEKAELTFWIKIYKYLTPKEQKTIEHTLLMQLSQLKK